MSLCDIDQGFGGTNCRDTATGGVSTVYLGTYPSGTTSYDQFITVDPVSGIVTGITNLTVYEYKPNQNSSNVIEEFAGDVAAGSISFNQKVSLVFSNLTAEKQIQLKKIANAYLVVIIKMKNGEFVIAGYESGAVLSGGQFDSGTAGADGNNYTLELTAEQGENLLVTTSAVVQSILGV